MLYVVIGSILLAIFEACRSKRSVYFPRTSRLRHRAPPPPGRWPLAWLRPVLLIEDDEVRYHLNFRNLEHYFYSRFKQAMCSAYTSNARRQLSYSFWLRYLRFCAWLGLTVGSASLISGGALKPASFAHFGVARFSCRSTPRAYANWRTLFGKLPWTTSSLAPGGYGGCARYAL